MKRSEINAVIRRFEAMLAEHCFELPPFLKFTPEEWETKGHEYDESPMHFHWNKMEDIINRGGGNIEFKLYNATEDEQLADTDVEIFQDGRRYTVPAGSVITLHPGESLTLYPYYYHEFVIPQGGGSVLIGEVSMCNDDNTDNRFLEPLGRFPTIEEDEPPYRLLCTEYPPAKD